MIHFTSWNRSSRREESNPSSPNILKGTFSLFKGLTFHRRIKQNNEVLTSGKAKNPRIPNKPKTKLFSLFSRSPSNPPPVPPKGLKSSSRPSSSRNEVAEYISISGAGEQGPMAKELPPQDEDTPRLETGPSVASFIALRSRWSCSTGSDSEEEASGSPRPVAANQGDEPASSRFGIPGLAVVETIGAHRSISHSPNNSIATSAESDRTVRPCYPINPAVEPQPFRRVSPRPQRALPPPPSSKHKEVERKECRMVQSSSPNRSGSNAEPAEGPATHTNPRYSAHYRAPGVVVDVSSGRPFNVAETEGQLRFYATVGSRHLYRATAMSARAYGYVVGPDHVLRRAPVSNSTDAPNA